MFYIKLLLEKINIIYVNLVKRNINNYIYEYIKTYYASTEKNVFIKHKAHVSKTIFLCLFLFYIKNVCTKFNNINPKLM